MTSEGEFKRRIFQQSKENAWDVIDEARREIFSAIHVEQGDGIRRRDIDAIKLFAALDKWFDEDNGSLR